MEDGRRTANRLVKGEVMMQRLRRPQTYFLLACVIFGLCSAHVRAQAKISEGKAQETSPDRDGQHDFDFDMGTWKTHLRRLLHPLTGSTAWVEYEGTTVVRKLWNGRANLAELEADGSAGHLEVLSLRLYDPQSHQWSLDTANSKSGTISVPTIGEFKNGRGEFFDTEPIGGRSILVRNVWSDITPDSCRFEQSFSKDGGKTWEVNWIATDTRMKEESDEVSPPHHGLAPNSSASQPGLPATPTGGDGQHDFAFEIGTWKIHLARLVHPLTGSHTWVEFDGTSVTRNVWEGRADIEQFETDGPTGNIEGLTLRLYNPQSRQWRLYWANSKDGILGQPMIGEFKNGRGEFFDQETFNGRAILVRYIWSGITPNAAHFEQSYSDDGGKSWEVNWITDQTRVNDDADKAH
jgi:hypothetical protein